jgi:hypothetical protein
VQLLLDFHFAAEEGVSGQGQSGVSGAVGGALEPV